MMQPAIQPGSALVTPDFRALFEAAPGAFLVILPNDPLFTIVTATDAFIRMARVRREDLIGRGLSEVFPAYSLDSNMSGLSNVTASLRRAIATHSSHIVPGCSETIPIMAADGSVAYLLHSVKEEPLEVTARKLAELRGESLESIAATTTTNCRRLLF